MEPYHYPDEGPIAFRRERDLGDVIRAAFQFMQATVREWGPAVLTIAAPFYVLGAIADALSGGTTAIGTLGSAAGGILLTATVFGHIRLYRKADASSMSVSDVWAEASPLIGPAFGWSLVAGLVAALLIAPAVLVIGIAMTDGDALTLGVILGVLALVVLAFLLPYYAVGLAARMLDADDIGDAFRQASQLIKAHRGFATGTTLLIYLLLGFATMILGGSLGALLGVFGASPVVEALATVGVIVALIPASVFAMVASVFLFETLIEREEGTLLDAEIEAIREGAPDETRPPVVPPPAPPLATREEPDTRSFAERLRDDRRAAEDKLKPGAGDDTSSKGPGGFRGGGFGEAE